MRTAQASVAPERGPRRKSAALLLAAALGGISPAPGLADPPSSPQLAESQDQAGDTIPWWARDKIDSAHFPGPAVSHYLLTRTPQAGTSYVYFPPVPPPLGTDLPLLAPFASGAPPPPELAHFVNELFYPMLAARLAADDLPKTLRAQLLAYSTAKVELQSELRSRIESLKDADLNARERQLAALAASQAPRIAEVWAAAERLRTDLRRAGLFGLPSGNADDAYISGGPLPPERDAPMVAGDLRLESEAMRGAAFFQDGLSAAQRELLRDAAIELWAETDPCRPILGSGCFISPRRPPACLFRKIYRRRWREGSRNSRRQRTGSSRSFSMPSEAMKVPEALARRPSGSWPRPRRRPLPPSPRWPRGYAASW